MTVRYWVVESRWNELLCYYGRFDTENQFYWWFQFILLVTGSFSYAFKFSSFSLIYNSLLKEVDLRISESKRQVKICSFNSARVSSLRRFFFTLAFFPPPSCLSPSVLFCLSLCLCLSVCLYVCLSRFPSFFLWQSQSVCVFLSPPQSLPFSSPRNKAVK